MRLTILILLFVSLLLLPPAVASQCIPTPTMGMGTHYKEINIHKVDISTGLVISGSVLSAMDCSPVADARIAHWQMNREGVYEDRLRAYLFSGEDGLYRFETEWPGAPIPHIHFIVTAEGYKKLVTNWIGSEQIKQITQDFVLQPVELLVR
ncbi:MAG: intradiol ring-cleavage dioxygenase [Gammaproteobacteria bacterium]|nr:intradiol ring-cleavage dioxygenase [Gammaproteobacteria bacterium]